ncbi:hypothetical protein [Vibrio sp. 10N.261.46.A3]|uniref:hypothetical protein n=1 Tax=Vibrio sp. 10N.261.46.A3 TaxID=3229658 RepID=UPI00354DB9A5
MKTAMTAIKYMQTESRIRRLASFIVKQNRFTTKEVSQALGVTVASVSASMQQLNKSWGFHFETSKNEGSRRIFQLVSCDFQEPLSPSSMTPLERLKHQVGNYPKSSIKYQILVQAINCYPHSVDLRLLWEGNGKECITNVLVNMMQAGFRIELKGGDMMISDFLRNTDKEEEVVGILSESQLPLAHQLMNQCTRESS